MTSPRLIVLLLAVSACAGPVAGGNPTVPEEPRVVLVATYVGGCAMGGPRCPTYQVSSDGSYSVSFGPGPDAGPIQAGVIDPAVAQDLIKQIEATDFRRLRARLQPGSCMAPVDGIDITYSWETGSGTQSLASCDYLLDSGIALLAQTSATIASIEKDLSSS